MNLGLLETLSATPVDYRHAMAMLDPEYHEWRPEGKPESRLDYVANVPLLTVSPDGICYLLGEPRQKDAAGMATFMRQRNINELNISGQEAVHLLSNHMLPGRWRYSRNYELTSDTFTPKPCGMVRRLMREDRHLLLVSLGQFPSLTASHSTLRDFEYMASGLPVACYGAIVDDRLVAFCSANPIYRGITEISWVIVASEFRRHGIASGLLTAQAFDILARDHRAAYYAGSAGEDLHAMVTGLGFREVRRSYRFIPASSPQQWRVSWGLPA